MLPEVNEIPAYLLNNLNTHQAVAVTSADLGDRVLASTSLHPNDLRPVLGLDSLVDVRKQEQVHMLTLLVVRLTPEVADLYFKQSREAYVVYIVTHVNWKPLEELMVSIGGDCHRIDQQDLAQALERTRQLSSAMIRKAVAIFPDIPALHGGKKGEWIILDVSGRRIDGISEETIALLGAMVIPKGIIFLNQLMEKVLLHTLH